MINYRDMTFCTFWETCKDSKTCGRALTPEVRKAAAEWWGSEDAPISVFSDKPSCHKEVKNETT